MCIRDRCNNQGCQVFRFARILFLVSSAKSETTDLSLMSRVQAFKQKKNCLKISQLVQKLWKFKGTSFQSWNLSNESWVRGNKVTIFFFFSKINRTVSKSMPWVYFPAVWYAACFFLFVVGKKWPFHTVSASKICVPEKVAMFLRKIQNVPENAQVNLATLYMWTDTNCNSGLPNEK